MRLLKQLAEANIGVIEKNSSNIYRYMNFDQIEDFREVADTVKV